MNMKNGGRAGPVALHQIVKAPAVLLKGLVFLKANFERFDLFSKKTTLGLSEPVIDPESFSTVRHPAGVF